MKRAFELLETSSRPVMLVGGGAISSGASPEILSLAERLHLPVATTLLGIGAFPATHSQYLGMPGVFGNYFANMALCHSDLIISVGARFSNRVTARADLFAPKARIIHIDIDPSSIGRTIRTDVPIVGDCRQALRQFLKIVEEKAYPSKYWQEKFSEWWEQLEIWKKAHPLQYSQDTERVKPQLVIEKIYELTEGKAVIATEVGQNQLWTAHFYKFNRPRSLITSGGLGTMGFGFPAAIGAQIGRPGEIVVDIAGDGSFQMTFKELATALDYRLPLKIVLFNNGHLGLVRQWQKIFHGGRCFAVQFHCTPNFVKLARAYGARAWSIQKPAEVEPVLKKALQSETLTLVEVHISPDETVFPLVPFGKSLQEMVLEPPTSSTFS